jgi:hypothetical protein
MTGTLSQTRAGTYLFESQSVELTYGAYKPSQKSLNYQDKLRNDPEEVRSEPLYIKMLEGGIICK